MGEGFKIKSQPKSRDVIYGRPRMAAHFNIRSYLFLKSLFFRVMNNEVNSTNVNALTNPEAVWLSHNIPGGDTYMKVDEVNDNLKNCIIQLKFYA